MKNYIILLLVFWCCLTHSQNYAPLNYFFNGTPTHGIKIKTNIPFQNGVGMPTVMLEGFNYGETDVIDIKLNWYVYNGEFIRYNASSSGAYAPEIQLANDNGKVSIFINDKKYYNRFSIRVYANGKSETATMFDGWTAVDEPISGTNIKTVIYSNSFGNDVVINTNGKVGIGTSNPTAGLQIEKGIPVNFIANFKNTDTGVSSNGLKVEVSNSSSNNTVQRWLVNNSEIMRVRADGNVGIGITNPQAELHIGKKTGVAGTSTRLILEPPMHTGGPWKFNTRDDNGTAYIDIAYGGSTRFTMKHNGQIGLGTNNPQEKLHVNGLIRLEQANNQDNDSPGIILVSNDDFLYDGKYLNHYGFGFHDFADINNTQRPNPYISGFYGIDFFSGGQNRLRISNTGDIGIGTTNPDSKLTVKGNIHAEEVKIDLNVPAPDYVFYDDYDLKTLPEVENYIAKNGHLPNIPSAKELEKDGLKVASMNLKLLEKIEELTLYTIDQEKRIESLEEKNEKLISLVEKLLENTVEKQN